jgi:surfactin synthase thioesterase subunit
MIINATRPQSPWFSSYRLPGQGQARIFAFPYSGAGSLAYYQWAGLFRDSPFDFIGVQLPGRENRLRETPFTDLPSLLDDFLLAITPLLDKPFVFFGHSLGALIAFELCRSLRRRGLPLPRHLFVSAFRAPDLPNPNRELRHLEDAGFIDGIRAYGGTPEEVFADQQLRDMLLPILRADFSLYETYAYREEAPLPCPLTALTGSADAFVAPEDMLDWRRQTAMEFQQIQYAGDHFFLHEHRADISRRLRLGLGV